MEYSICNPGDSVIRRVESGEKIVVISYTDDPSILYAKCDDCFTEETLKVGVVLLPNGNLLYINKKYRFAVYSFNEEPNTNGTYCELETCSGTVKIVKGKNNNKYYEDAQGYRHILPRVSINLFSPYDIATSFSDKEIDLIDISRDTHEAVDDKGADLLKVGLFSLIAVTVVFIAVRIDRKLRKV